MPSQQQPMMIRKYLCNAPRPDEYDQYMINTNRIRSTMQQQHNNNPSNHNNSINNNNNNYIHIEQHHIEQTLQELYKLYPKLQKKSTVTTTTNEQHVEHETIHPSMMITSTTTTASSSTATTTTNNSNSNQHHTTRPGRKSNAEYAIQFYEYLLQQQQYQTTSNHTKNDNNNIDSSANYHDEEKKKKMNTPHATTSISSDDTKHPSIMTVDGDDNNNSSEDIIGIIPTATTTTTDIEVDKSLITEKQPKNINLDIEQSSPRTQTNTNITNHKDIVCDHQNTTITNTGTTTTTISTTNHDKTITPVHPTVPCPPPPPKQQLCEICGQSDTVSVPSSSSPCLDGTTTTTSSTTKTANTDPNHNKNSTNSTSSSSLIQCSTCPYMFHTQCVRPKPIDITSDWQCSYCILQEHNTHQHKSSHKHTKERKQAAAAIRYMARLKKQIQGMKNQTTHMDHHNTITTENNNNNDPQSQIMMDTESDQNASNHISSKTPTQSVIDTTNNTEDVVVDVATTTTSSISPSRSSKRCRKQPTLYNPQDGPASRWQTDELTEWKLSVRAEASMTSSSSSSSSSSHNSEDDDDNSDHDNVDEDGSSSSTLIVLDSHSSKSKRNKIHHNHNTRKFIRDHNNKYNHTGSNQDKNNHTMMICNFCQDNPNIPVCVFCACRVCYGKHCQNEILLCDICDDEYHIFCLNPPLSTIPDHHQSWYCPKCINHTTTKHVTDAISNTTTTNVRPSRRVVGNFTKDGTTTSSISPSRRSSRSPKLSTVMIQNQSNVHHNNLSTGTTTTKGVQDGSTTTTNKKSIKVMKRPRGRPPKVDNSSSTTSSTTPRRSNHNNHDASTMMNSTISDHSGHSSSGGGSSNSNSSTSHVIVKRKPGRPPLLKSGSAPNIRTTTSLNKSTTIQQQQQQYTSDQPRKRGRPPSEATLAKRARLELSVQKKLRIETTSKKSGMTSSVSTGSNITTPTIEYQQQQESLPITVSRSGRTVKRSNFHDEIVEGAQHLKSTKYYSTHSGISSEPKHLLSVPESQHSSTTSTTTLIDDVDHSTSQTLHVTQTDVTSNVDNLSLPVMMKSGPAPLSNTNQSNMDSASLPQHQLNVESSLDVTDGMTIDHDNSDLFDNTDAYPSAASVDAGQNEAHMVQHSSNQYIGDMSKQPRRKPGARECMQISRRFGVKEIPQQYMDILLDYCNRGKVEHLLRMRERLDEHSRFLEMQLAGLEALVLEHGESDVVVPLAPPSPDRRHE